MGVKKQLVPQKKMGEREERGKKRKGKRGKEGRVTYRLLVFLVYFDTLICLARDQARAGLVECQREDARLAVQGARLGRGGICNIPWY